MSQAGTLEQPLGITSRSHVAQVLLAIAVIAHGLVLLFLTVVSPRGFYNSPDETANIFFSQGVERDGHLVRPVFRPGLPDSVTPRSMLRNGDTLIPVGFVSVPIVLGLLAKLVGIGGIPYVVILISTGALAAWYGFLRRMFGNRIAILSVLLTAGHPLVMYWGQRPLYPNVMFMALTMYALYAASTLARLHHAPLPREGAVQMERPTLEQRRTKRVTSAILAGLLLGLALTFRPAEGIWLLPIFAILLWRGSRHRWLSRILCGVSASIPLLGLLALQYMVYGSPIRTGYHLTSDYGSVIYRLVRLLIPFGVDVSAMTAVASYYGVTIIWWLMVLVIFAMIMIGIRRGGRLVGRLRLWLLASIAVFLWLLFYYGSFQITDRFDRIPSVGSSFSRYFLPLYVMTTPLIAYALFVLRRRFGSFLVLVLVPLSVILSLRLVFWSSDESAREIATTLEQNRLLHDRMLTLVPGDGIILTDRLDKVFFPSREVVTRFRSFHQPDFAALYPYRLYYETVADADVVEFENDRFWGPHRLKAVDPVDLGYRHTLYKLELQDKQIKY